MYATKGGAPARESTSRWQRGEAWSGNASLVGMAVAAADPPPARVVKKSSASIAEVRRADRAS
jgi:hypothetical protein